MKDNPCDSKCPAYPSCQHRDAIGKYEICPKFRQAVIHIIEESQKETDKEKGKGLTVIGVRIGPRGPMIDKNGDKISD